MSGQADMRVGLVTVLVPDYDAGIAFYCGVLGFRLLEDVAEPGKRWVVVSAGSGADLLLAQATSAAQRSRIGDQCGGRVGFFLYCRDIVAEYSRLMSVGVVFEEDLRSEAYGRVAVFRDPFGNRWDLIEDSADA